MLVLQSRFDEIIDASYHQDSVQLWCDQGATVEYRLTSWAGEHLTYAVAHVAEAVAYLETRFAGLPARSTC